MAWTVTVVEKTIVGNKRLHVLQCTADAATQAVVTGLGVVDHFSYGPVSMSDAAVSIYKNTTASGAATPGTLGCSGFTSGDICLIHCYGR